VSASGTAVERIRRLDSAAVSDALDRCGIDSGVVTGLHRLAGAGGSGGSSVVAGRAITVLLGPPLSSAASSRHLATSAVESGGSEDVIVVAHQGRRDCAGWGGNLSRAACARGIAGTVVDGAVRDVDEATAIGYVVFAAASTPRTARGRASEHGWNVPVEVAGVVVSPGDLVIADGTGLAVVPAARADEVLDAAEQIVAHEMAMAREIDDGRPISVVMGSSYEQATSQGEPGHG
jgi:4-hydroxy-4-methyl-2-oxoglutarate aldolase